MNLQNPVPAELASDLRTVLRRLLTRLRAEDVGDNLTVSQRSALKHIGDHGPLTLSALATLVAVRPQSMSATVAQLEVEGYVRRQPDPQDGRQQLLSLTKSGRHLLDQGRTNRNAWLARALEQQCTAAERRALAAALPVLAKLENEK